MTSFADVYETGVIGNTYTVNDGTSPATTNQSSREYQEWYGRNFSGVLVSKQAGPPRTLVITDARFGVNMTVTEPSGLVADNTALSAPRQTLSKYAAIVQCNSAGTAKAGQLPVTIVGRRYKGMVEVTSSATWACTASNYSQTNNTFGISTFTGNSTVVYISSTLDGVTLTDAVTITKVIDATDTSTIGSNTTTFSMGSGSSISTTVQNVSTILTSGSTWSVPSGVTSVLAECWGAGGGGGGANGWYGAGGGGGAYSAKTLAVTGGSLVAYAVGTGGTAGNAGGDTWLDTTSTVLAKGGSAGGGYTGGAGGSASSSVGDVKASGGDGGGGGSSGSYAGGGGSSAGSSNGTTATAGNVGSRPSGGSAPVATAGTNSGAGGTGGNGSSQGSDGQAPGGGGGGNIYTTGGFGGQNANAGANGQIRVSYANGADYSTVYTCTGVVSQRSGQTIVLSANIMFNVHSSSTDKNGEGSLLGKWQYRQTGTSGAWIDIDVEDASDSPCSWNTSTGTGTDGTLTVASNCPTLSVGTGYDFRLQLRVNTATSTMSLPFKTTAGCTGTIQW